MEVRIGRAIYSTDNNCFFMPTEVASTAVKKLRKRGYRVRIERMSKYTVKVIAIGPSIDRLFVKEYDLLEACQMIVKGYNDGGKLTREAMQNIARQAIAKEEDK
ncbi:hypothetical protein KAR91_60275 [Candidatus Pacearchaeota archaeon]|nr:hypothetical protein [Candidatus Pacearchaeota archaeon]